MLLFYFILIQYPCLRDNFNIIMVLITKIFIPLSFITIMISILNSYYVSSEEWKKLKASDREKLGIVFENDGEFWSVQTLFIICIFLLFRVLVLDYLLLLLFACFVFDICPYLLCLCVFL